MSDGAVDRMHARARAVRARAAVRQWQYRQRHLAAGAWFRLRRTLADARAAYAISSADAQTLLAEGYAPDACGTSIEPGKTILFVDEARLTRLESMRPIPVRLGPDFLVAAAVALLPFDEACLRGRRGQQRSMCVPPLLDTADAPHGRGRGRPDCRQSPHEIRFFSFAAGSSKSASN